MNWWEGVEGKLRHFISVHISIIYNCNNDIYWIVYLLHISNEKASAPF
jgi:hypothetical protein